jgi:hypothetical protein
MYWMKLSRATAGVEIVNDERFLDYPVDGRPACVMASEISRMMPGEHDGILDDAVVKRPFAWSGRCVDANEVEKRKLAECSRQPEPAQVAQVTNRLVPLGRVVLGEKSSVNRFRLRSAAQVPDPVLR